MSKKPDGPSFFEKLATAIVDRRNLIFFLYLCAMIFCAISSGWVQGLQRPDRLPSRQHRDAQGPDHHGR